MNQNSNILLKRTKQIQTNENKFSRFISSSATHTKVFDDDFIFPQSNFEQKLKERIVFVTDSDSISAVFTYSTDLISETNKIAILDFADYAAPAGRYRKDDITSQEASLCDNSLLYNILTRFTKFYRQNAQDKNYSLYHNRALYIPHVKFNIDSDYCFCDVISCAAPDKTNAIRFCRKSPAENTEALKDRIKFILNIANFNKVNTLILGAWGCGGHGQNSLEVADIFKQELYKTIDEEDNLAYPYIENVIFAIPYSGESQRNYFDFSITFPDY